MALHRDEYRVMKEYILLLPIMFIFHDMEEIVGFRWFFRRNWDVFAKYPKIAAVYRDVSTEGFAAAVYEEFIPFFGLSLLAYYFPCRMLYGVWFAMLLGLTAHFVIHISVCIYIRRYVPSLITSLICLPFAAVMLTRAVSLMTFDMPTLISAAVTLPMLMLNLRFAHSIMRRAGR